MEYVFCDTMVFLHFKMFQEINFCDILNVKSVTLIIPEAVSDEIDKHKDNHSIKRIRSRASMISSKFYDFLVKTPNSEYCVNENFKIKFLLYEPFDYDAYGLNQNKSDHQIIASIIAFSKTINDSDHITFITHDNGASLTAKKYNITFSRLPDDLKLADELSQEDKKIKNLEEELATYKYALPILKLQGKKSKDSVVKYTNDDLLGFKHPDNVLTIEQIKNECPPFPEHDLNPSADNAKFANLLAGIYIEDSLKKENIDIRRYMREREQYFSDYQNYLLAIKEKSEKILLKVELEIINIGNVPAESVDIHIHFPNGFEMFLDGDLPAAPECPQKPLVPRTASELMFADITRHVNFDFNMTPEIHEKMFHKSFSLKKGNSYDFRDSYKIIKHGNHVSHDVLTMFLVFANINNIKNFQCQYILSGTNIPKAVEGCLNFVFDLK